MTGDERLSGELVDLAAEILAGGGITADDVLTLRRGLYKDGVVEPGEAELLFYLDAHGKANDDAWNAFFVEALADDFVTTQHPPGVLSQEGGEFLVARLGKDGRIERKMEFALLLEIVERAWSCPDAVVLLVLQAVKETVLKGGGVLFGAKRRRRGSSTRPTSTSKQGMGRTLAAAAVMPPGKISMALLRSVTDGL